MKRGPIPDDDDSVARKGKVVTTTEEWPELLRCTTTKPPPILLDELIEEILLRIPARSLVRLRNSVCSSWRTLISSSRFAKDHLRRSMAVDPALTDPRIAYYSSWQKYYPVIGVFSVRSVFENRPHESTKVVAYEGRLLIIGSCNGLLCLNDNESAMLWNPCTGFTSQPLEIGRIFYVCGFGYDHVNDKYKLFLVEKKIEKSGGSVTRIFTFGPKSTWRTIQDFPYNEDTLMNTAGLFVSGTGTLNWLLCSGRTSFVAVLSLDLVKETYSQFPLPSRDSDDALCVFPRLGILRGCLAVCYETKQTHWTLWMMKEYGVPQSWTRLAIIPHHPLLVNPRSSYALEPMYMLKNDVLLVLSPSGKFVLCNLNDGSIDFPSIDSSAAGIPQLPPLSHGPGGWIFHIYHESLVSPSHFGLPTCSSSQIRLFKPTLSLKPIHLVNNISVESITLLPGDVK
ncbi:F-box/kelch-repeat protein At3g23880-like [Arachis ipaensis]|uniref:F-box/kelch-repeat protein At3g23880-like n=1 Tax=Arachis ipaensis TaxID=130454 RepID=UPI0007AF31E3|nr:F-box/kelch-repeat protein At3g23880-like [Arachis ipaensis]